MNPFTSFKQIERLPNEIIRDLNLESEIAEITAMNEGMPNDDLYSRERFEKAASRKWIQFVSFLKSA